MTTSSPGGKAYGAREGFDTDEADMRSAILRAERDGKRISRNTKLGQAKAREQGVRFDSPKIAEARAESILVRRTNASECREEFRAVFFDAKIAGAVTDPELVDFFNAKAFLSPNGRLWTRANVGRMRRELEAAGSSEPPLVVGPDGLTPSGFDRFRRVLVAKGISGKELTERLYLFSAGKLHEATARQLAETIEKKERELREAATAEEERWGSF